MCGEVLEGDGLRGPKERDNREGDFGGLYRQGVYVSIREIDAVWCRVLDFLHRIFDVHYGVVEDVGRYSAV